MLSILWAKVSTEHYRFSLYVTAPLVSLTLSVTASTANGCIFRVRILTPEEFEQIQPALRK